MRTNVPVSAAEAANLLMKKTDVAKLLGCSLRQIEHLVKSGRIPQPIQLGPNSPRWRRPELLQALGFVEQGVHQ